LKIQTKLLSNYVLIRLCYLIGRKNGEEKINGKRLISMLVCKRTN